MTRDRQWLSSFFKAPFSEQNAAIYRDQMRVHWSGGENYREHVEELTDKYHGMPGHVGDPNAPSNYIRLTWIEV